MEIEKRDLAFYDENSKEWVTEPGQYTIKIGASSKDIKFEKIIKVTGNENKYFVNSKSNWRTLQENKNICKIVAKYVGYDAVIEAVWFGEPTLEEFLKNKFEKDSSLKGDGNKQKELIDKIIKEINGLYI